MSSCLSTSTYIVMCIILCQMKNLRARGADIISWPPTYYDLIREKLKDSPVKVAESIDTLQELNILIDFDERGYMLQVNKKLTNHIKFLTML